jgi:hypothetical protein
VASIDELVTVLDANKQAADELTAQIEASKQLAEELVSAAQSLGAGGVVTALQSAKDQIEQAATQNAATADQLEQARAAAEAAKHA